MHVQIRHDHRGAGMCIYTFLLLHICTCPCILQVRYAVAQITQYIQELGTEFGVLSSFSRTWFFKAKLVT